MKQQAEKIKEPLKEQEAAKFLGLTVRTLQSWRTNQKGPDFLKMGKSVRYRMEDLKAFAASSTVKCERLGDA